ncbi:MAG: glycosyltransferase [Bacteroidota bacterium]|nr:glycosyltransferase [Bacteroidota bacterium]
MGQAINIISFDVPFPANYGGVIDVFYKLVALKNAGVKIHLHCFEYGRQHPTELEGLCEKIYYYKRNTSVSSHFSLLPYTVKSRQSKQLEENLLSNNYPILFEVLHTCYLLNDSRFANRKKIYRHSNIEHEYYSELAKAETSLIKKLFLKVEAFKLKRFEKILNKANLILAVNKKDADYFAQKYSAVKTLYLPSFHQNNTLTIKEGKGDYCLYNGNLSVSENYEAALWLIENVFSKINFKVIIAGLNPPQFLETKISNYKNIELIKNPSQQQMNELIANAQIHTLYTKQPTGLKLKLLNVLYAGRFVVCNSNMVAGTDLKADESIFICNTPNDFINSILTVFLLSFKSELVTKRDLQLDVFSNLKNTQLLLNEVF